MTTNNLHGNAQVTADFHKYEFAYIRGRADKKGGSIKQMSFNKFNV
jgi:hypothetical protein